MCENDKFVKTIRLVKFSFNISVTLAQKRNCWLVEKKFDHFFYIYMYITPSFYPFIGGRGNRRFKISTLQILVDINSFNSFIYKFKHIQNWIQLKLSKIRNQFASTQTQYRYNFKIRVSSTIHCKPQLLFPC